MTVKGVLVLHATRSPSHSTLFSSALNPFILAVCVRVRVFSQGAQASLKLTMQQGRPGTPDI